MNQKRFVLLDRDGTLIREKHYLSDPEEVELLPGTISALKRLQEMGLGLIVVTNQSPIGRGLFDEKTLGKIHDRLEALLSEGNIVLDGLFFCPHTPEDDCICRKPNTGMVTSAAAELDFEPAQSFMVGDKTCDIELGARIGAVTLLVRTGYGSRELESGLVSADFVVDDVAEAAQLIEKILPDRQGE